MPGHESVAVERGLVDDVDVGLNLVQLIDKYKGKLIGETVYKKYGNKFPLLVKFIDSRQDLSVQVHPDDKLAMERHGCAGKTLVIKRMLGLGHVCSSFSNDSYGVNRNNYKYNQM